MSAVATEVLGPEPTTRSSSARSGPRGWTTSSARRASRSSSRSPRRREGARRGARPRPPGRPAGPRQDEPGADRPRGARRRHPHGRRAGARAEGRHGGDPDRARAARRPLRGRDPPAQPRDRGDPLPGARGLPARHHRRPGPGGADADARPAAVHARRRDDAHRPADDAAPRPLRHDLPARLLRAGAAWPRSCGARPASSASRSTTTRRRDRPPRPRHAADRQPDPAARPRRRRGAPPGRDHDRGRARRSTCWRSTARAWTRPTASSCARSVARFGGGPVGLSTLAVALGEDPDTLEDVYDERGPAPPHPGVGPDPYPLWGHGSRHRPAHHADRAGQAVSTAWPRSSKPAEAALATPSGTSMVSSRPCRRLADGSALVADRRALAVDVHLQQVLAQRPPARPVATAR